MLHLPPKILLQGRALTTASIVQTWLDGGRKPQALSQQPNAASAPSPSPGAAAQLKITLSTSGIWAMEKNARKAAWAGWEAAITAEAAERVARRVASHDMHARELSELQLQRDLQRVRGARVIGCTTTGAAIHAVVLAEARCGVVLVEEAAEVLEAHVLTALSDSTKHLIMIGTEYGQPVLPARVSCWFWCCLARLCLRGYGWEAMLRV